MRPSRNIRCPNSFVDAIFPSLCIRIQWQASCHETKDKSPMSRESSALWDITVGTANRSGYQRTTFEIPSSDHESTHTAERSTSKWLCIWDWNSSYGIKNKFCYSSSCHLAQLRWELNSIKLIFCAVIRCQAETVNSLHLRNFHRTHCWLELNPGSSGCPPNRGWPTKACGCRSLWPTPFHFLKRFFLLLLNRIFLGGSTSRSYQPHAHLQWAMPNGSLLPPMQLSGLALYNTGPAILLIGLR